METILCPNCQEENEIERICCRNCNYPIGTNSTTDPVQSALAEGSMIGKGIKSPKKFIIIIGMWVLFGIFGFVYLFLAILTLKDDLLNPIAIGIGFLGIIFLLFSIFSTKNYLKYKKEFNKMDKEE
jgi:hypothetical protein